MAATTRPVDGTATRRRWGIAHALVLLVLATLTPFILLEVYRGAQDVDRRRETVADRARVQADEEAETLDDFLRYTERFLASLAASPAVQALDAGGAAALFHAVRTNNPNYENIFLLTAGGEQRASTVPDVEDPQVTERPYFQKAIRQGSSALSDALVWPGTGRSVVVLAYPVTSPDGSRLGVVAIALNIARLSTVIGYSGLPEGSVVLLAQEDGTVIAASEGQNGWVGRSLTGWDVFEQTRARATGVLAGDMPDGVERVTGYQRLQRAPWVVLAGIPHAEVSAEQRRALMRVLQQSALAVLVAAVLAAILLRRVVAPIRMLSDGARAFAAGLLDRRIPLRRRDELGDLAGTMNTMAAALDQRLAEEAAHAEALERLNQLQAEFVATASHELRTPVTAIRSYAEALRRPDITDEGIRQECLEGIDRSSERLARLVRTLLDVSRIDSGRVTVELGAVDAEAAARAAAQAAVPNDDAVRVVAPPGLPPALADADRLEDVLANLIGNARKFSPPGAPVTVRLSAADSRLRIAVADRGAGIAPEERERIFDRFYQVQRGADRRAGGAGLGLYIARAYIEAMGGRIDVESTSGQGSTFTVVLSAAATPAPDTDNPRGGGHAAGTGAARGR